MKKRIPFLICLLLVVMGASGVQAFAWIVEEASGIARLGPDLLIVGDDDPGAYYRVTLSDQKGPAIPIDSSKVMRVALPRGTLALDLEAIDVLADGRIVVLSERLRALISEDGVVAEYDHPLSEFGNRGLEGLAVRRLGDGSSRIAVLWEGGYPEYKDVLGQLQRPVGRLPLLPVILVHDLKPGKNAGKIKAKHTRKRIELDVPKPTGQEPQAQRFRAPDLVWHHLGEKGCGFIVLLSSQNSPEVGKTKYMHTWLQRFTIDGRSLGEPLDLKRLLPTHLKKANWEGLGWFEDCETVVIIHDKPPKGPPTAFIVALPDSWKTESCHPKPTGSHLN